MNKVLIGLFALLALVAAPVDAGFSKVWLSSATITGAGGDPICSANYIDQKRHYLITAAHCLDQERFGTPYINGEHIAFVVVKSVEADIAVLHTPTWTQRAIKLAKHGVELNDMVQMVGHPVGLKDNFLFRGFVANEFTNLAPDVFHRAVQVYQFPVCHGNSGSAIANEKEEVVSVMQMMFDQDNCSAISIGAVWSDVWRIAGPYFGK